MRLTKAACGHDVPAVGQPGSAARRAQEQRHCGLDRCKSGLPAKFTDEECAAYVWLMDRGIRPWLVDLLTKQVNAGTKRYASLVAFARAKGWYGGGKF